MNKVLFQIFILCFSGVVLASSVAKVTLIEGDAVVMKKGSDTWRQCKVNMALQIDDQVFSKEESLVEMTYTNGEIVRIGENTKLRIYESTERAVKTEVLMGNVWVNMKKLTSGSREFEMSSPTATAAIRGTIFNMTAFADSSADVSVYDGKVAVGPTAHLKSKMNRDDGIGKKEPTEIPGPHEIPGPYEVPLEQWKIIVAGQKISVHADGKYATEKIGPASSFDQFTLKNQKLDTQNKPK